MKRAVTIVQGMALASGFNSRLTFSAVNSENAERLLLFLASLGRRAEAAVAMCAFVLPVLVMESKRVLTCAVSYY